MTSNRSLTGVFMLFVLAVLAACGSGDDDPPPAAATSASAVIGPAGGTLTGPDGVQVVVPAGALSGNTTIGIARNAAGAPAPLQEGNAPAGPIYEFTPHDVVFNVPVTIRIPVPANAANSEVFMASLGGDWMVNSATPNGAFAEWQRNSFSFGMAGLACAIPAGSTDPYPCSYPSGGATVTATPGTAITQIAAGWLNFGSGSAGSWRVNPPGGTVSVTLHYRAVPDCSAVGGGGLSGNVRLIRWNPAVALNTPGRVTTLFDQPVALTQQPVTPPLGSFSHGGGPTFRGVGSTTIDVSSYLGDATNVFGFTFSCQRPGGPVHTGGDLITIIGPMAAPSGPYTIGGTVSGLTGAGLVLRNNGGDDEPVPANATTFTFNTAVADGAPYSVSVLTQPGGQTCTVQNGTGTANAVIANIAVTCSPSSPGGLALVANSGSNTLSILRRDAATGALSALGTVATGAHPYRVVITPNGLYAYATNLVGGSISSYSINTGTGVLTPIPLSTPATVNPYGIAMDPLGRFLWVTNYSSSTASAFVIGANGVLAASGPPVSTGTLPYALAAHPGGNFVYVANESGNSISAFSVDAVTGVLTLLGGTIANSVLAPHGIAIDPSGQFVYVATSGGQEVAAFRINANGSLTVIGYINSNGLAQSVVVHPNGQFVYVANRGGGRNISVFSINAATGALTQVGSPVALGSDPGELGINSAGSVLYVTNLGGNSASAFSIGSGGATLTSLGAATPAGNAPEGIALTPSASYTIGGTVSGLTGAGLVLRNNGGDDEPVPANATTFTFNTAVADGTPYSVSIFSQPSAQSCTVQNASGTASGNVGNVQINCGNNGNIAQVVSGSGSACARYADGGVKCWGTNQWGELGLGDLATRGDTPAEMGSALPFVNLGTGRTAVQLSAGSFHVCAVLDNGSLKCWGNNGGGQLGLGLSPVSGSPASRIGDDPSEMGDGLPAINLGTGRTVLEVAAGFDHTCARLDNGTVKCWGSNQLGQTGLGNASQFGANAFIGNDSAEMGDGLPALPLGSGRSAVAIRAGYQSTCALLDNQTLKCWGTNEYGQLGLGDVNTRGDVPGEMGDNLPAVDVGTGRLVVEFNLGFGHSCVRLDNDSIKCWGRNANGQLGLGDIGNRGDAPGEMGDNLPAVNLGTGRTAVGLASGGSVTCARLDNGGAKCWGYNLEGQLGLGDTNDRGDNPGEMGDNLAVVQLGTGRTAVELSADSAATCARLDNGTVKCWGYNLGGQLGLGDANNRGDAPGEMGDNLPIVDLTP